MPETRQIAAIVPKSAVGSVDAAAPDSAWRCSATPRPARGSGTSAPVYDYWNTNPLGFVPDWRFGGGAGEVDSGLDSKDTDTRDPSAIDIIVGTGRTRPR